MRSGSALPSALEMLARNTPRRLGDFLNGLNSRIKEGEPLGEALLRQQPRVTAMEASIVTASSLGGRLDHGCDQLARYFEALERARREMVGGMMYPLLVLHFAPFVFAIQIAFNSGAIPFLEAVGEKLLFLYAIGGAIWFLWLGLNEAARTNVTIDWLLGRIPGIGPVRQKFALARFFAMLDAQLEAQVNVWDAFANAARTSDSARIVGRARSAMPALQSGSSLGEALAANKVLPEEYVRSLSIAEQAGELDAELTRAAQQSEEMAVAALKRWSEWLPRLIYFGVLLYTAYQIIMWYLNYFSAIKSFESF